MLLLDPQLGPCAQMSPRTLLPEERDRDPSGVSGLACKSLGFVCFFTSQDFSWAKQLSICPWAMYPTWDPAHDVCCLHEFSPRRAPSPQPTPQPCHTSLPAPCCPGPAHHILGLKRCDCHISHFWDMWKECSGPCSRCRLSIASNCCLG